MVLKIDCPSMKIKSTTIICMCSGYATHACAISRGLGHGGWHPHAYTYQYMSSTLRIPSAISNLSADGYHFVLKTSNIRRISCLEHNRADDCSRSYHCLLQQTGTLSSPNFCVHVITTDHSLDRMLLHLLAS